MIDKKLKINIVSFIFAVACLGLYFFFPINDSKFEIFLGTFIFLLILPVLYTKLVLHDTYNEIGFSPFLIDLRELLFIGISIVLGGLLSFVIVSIGWGVESYAKVLSKVIFVDFSAFAMYEILFSAVMLFLFTFFAWGFVYSIKCENKLITYSISLIIFIIFLMNFYTNIWIVLPLIVPAFFVSYIREDKNILYMYGAIFMINLILDTLIIKTFT
jgi:hypothetical protein